MGNAQDELIGKMFAKKSETTREKIIDLIASKPVFSQIIITPVENAGTSTTEYEINLKFADSIISLFKLMVEARKKKYKHIPEDLLGKDMKGYNQALDDLLKALGEGK